ncbi:ATP-binding protein [Gudongella sp. SC589]|jgi:uncharacterized protein YhaN|uniref:ATP-binding protein n=1 Tax=Gudongella sp. SC589 TaxID=3385990 RepID=UPI003904BBEB
MIIRELHLHGFGKFNDFTLRLQPGLNIIYGPNESGKSTLHSFISGMFYGFRKPYTKRTLYSNEHNRLTPWSGSNYSGSIVFEKDGQLYRIYRVFDKGKEEVKVFHELTGEDITDRTHIGESSKVLQPGEYFFGINSGVFSNTLFIGQQNMEPGESLAHEVRERLVNVSTGGDESISVERAILFLDEELREIGTSRASTSEYGKILAEIKETEESLRAVEADVKKYRDLATRRMAIISELESVEMDIANCQDSIEEMNRIKKINKYQEILELREKNNLLGEEIERLVIHDSKSRDDYNEAVKLSEEIGLVNSRLDYMEEQLNGIEEKATRLYVDRNHEYGVSEDIIEDGYKFQKLDYKSTDDRDLPSLKNEKEKLMINRRAFEWILIIFSFIYFSVTIYASIQGNYSVLAITQTVLIPIFYFIYKVRTLKGRTDILEGEIDVEIQKVLILDKYSVSNKYDLYKLYERAREEDTKAEQERVLLDELQGSREAISVRKNDLNTELMALQRQLDGIFSKNQAEDMKSFNEGLEKKSRLKEIKREIEYNQETIKRILKEESIEELTVLYEERSDTGSAMSLTDMVETIESHEKLIQYKGDLLVNLNQVEGSLMELENSIEQELTLNEKLQKLREKEFSLKCRKESLEMAKSRINDLSGEIHRDFVPALNRRVEEFISRITAGRYIDAKVDRNLNFNLVQEGTNRLVPLENLSGGTLDQMYFGLRLGIVDELISSRLPIFLDECFSQYDDLRLKRILDFIISFEYRQVLLFTCQTREEEVLRSTGKKYNKIDLQNS